MFQKMQHNQLKKENVERICQKLSSYRQILQAPSCESTLLPSGSLTCWQQSGWFLPPLVLVNLFTSGATWELIFHQKFPETEEIFTTEMDIVSNENLILNEDYPLGVQNIQPGEKCEPVLRVRSDLFTPTEDNSQDLHSNPECLTIYDELGEKKCVTLYADFGPNTIAEFFQ